MKRKRALALLAALLLAAPGFGAPLSIDGIEAHVGALVMGNYTSDNGLSSPMMFVGASTILEALPRPWVIGLGLDLMGAWYDWNYDTGFAQLSDPEWGGGTVSGEETSASFFTVGVIASPRFGARFELGGAFSLGAFLGLDLLVRFPLDPFTPAPVADAQIPALVYFAAGRFLYPETSLWFALQASESVKVTLTLRALWPLYRIWSPEVSGGATFLHQVAFAATLGATIPLGKPATIGEPAAETPEAATAEP